MIGKYENIAKGKTRENLNLSIDRLTNEDESTKYANALKNDGHYPAGLDGCFIVGISGGCGTSCWVYKQGNCEKPQEMELETDEEIKEYKELYGND